MDHFNDKGHLTDQALALYAEALKMEKQEQLPNALREHLEECPHCQEQAMALYALIADEDYSGLGPHPTFGQRGGRTTAATLKMWFRPLLLLLMALLAFFLFLQQQQREEQPPATEDTSPASVPMPQTGSRDTTALSPPQARVEVGSRKSEIGSRKSEGGSLKSEGGNRKSEGGSRKAEGGRRKAESVSGQQREAGELQASEIIAANFTPSETLEPLVGAVTRSYGLSDILPPAGAELEIGKAVVFSWRASVEAPLTLRLLNNQEEEVFSRSVEGSRLSGPDDLEPGLYYWKLETADDLLYVGKFFLR